MEDQEVVENPEVMESQEECLGKTIEEIFADDTDRLLSIREVAVRLRTSHAFVSGLINAGLLPALKFGTNRRIRKVVFNAFLEENDGCDLPALLAAQKSATNGR